MSRTLIAALTKLIQAPEGGLPASSLTESQQRAIDTFGRRTSCLRRQPQGRGVVYRITDRETLTNHLKALSPAVALDLPADLPARAQNIARYRNSKGGEHQHDVYYMLLKAVEPDVIWTNENGDILDVSAATKKFGVAALALSRDDSWRSNKPLWLTENQALFDKPQWHSSLLKGAISYYPGQLNKLLIDWLATRNRAEEVVLFPDYDGVGLMNYVRLRERGVENISFWLMPGWENLLKKFGSRDVWNNTREDFLTALSRLASLSPPFDLMALVHAMHTEGLALEQEAVWLAANNE